MIIKKILQIFLFFIRFQLFFNPSTTETSLRFEDLAEGDEQKRAIMLVTPMKSMR